jgi:hypothetical protein
MTGFSISWLDLREKADFAARNKQLLIQALAWLRAGHDALVANAIVVDLGAGTGSTLRAMTALNFSLGVNYILWRLVDQDGDLLDTALLRHGKTCQIEDYQADLTVIEELPLAGARLVTASALFDLVSGDFIDKLVVRIAHHRTGIYAALNYDGTTTWTPTHPLDKAVLAAFNLDQRCDKGFGLALGPDATGYLKKILENSGYTVLVGSSAWLLTAEDHALVSELISGIARAVAVGYGLDANALKDWEIFRLKHAQLGTCTIGHQDLLALPA